MKELRCTHTRFRVLQNFRHLELGKGGESERLFYYPYRRLSIHQVLSGLVDRLLANSN